MLAHATDFFKSSDIVIINENIIFSTQSSIFSYNLNNGYTNWEIDVSAISIPIIDGKNIFFVTENGYFVIINIDTGKIISSTRIRECLQNGNIYLANKLLSRTWFVDGVVDKGKKLGRKLGYRTCNICIKNYILPKIGIYAVKVLIGNKSKIYGGVAYLGARPTFGGKEIVLETHIFGIRKNLYKKRLRVYFIKFIRGERKFKNKGNLIKQMNKDVIFAKKGLKIKLVL